MIASLWVSVVVVTGFTIMIAESCPLWLKRLMIRYVLLNIIVNFLVSFIVSHFAGTGFLVGISNLAASVIGTLWILAFWPGRYTTKPSKEETK